MLNKTTAIERVERQRSLVEDVAHQPRFSPEFKKWRRDTEVAITNVFGENTRHLTDFERVCYSLGAFTSGTPEDEFEQAFQRGLRDADALLQSLIDEVKEYWSDEPSPDQQPSIVSRLERLADRFHLVARRLRDRHNSRGTIQVEDEYDVQDLLHAMLMIDFDDIRCEEWAPSVAGACSRIDFLLKTEQVVIEAKKTRKGLAAKEAGEQLLVDIARYQAHPDCRVLFCFIYDPEGRIGNPAGLERDLTKRHGDLDVRVVVAPKGL